MAIQSYSRFGFSGHSGTAISNTVQVLACTTTAGMPSANDWGCRVDLGGADAHFSTGFSVAGTVYISIATNANALSADTVIRVNWRA